MTINNLDIGRNVDETLRLVQVGPRLRRFCLFLVSVCMEA